MSNDNCIKEDCELHESKMIAFNRNWLILIGIMYTLFMACFTSIIVLQTVLINRQNNMERLVMMVLASQSPTAQLEDLLNQYFIGNIQNNKIAIDNRAMQENKRRKN